MYRERLWPGAWAWVGALSQPTVLAIAYGAAYGLVIGGIAWITALTLAMIGMVATTPLIEVTEDSLRAGRARIPRQVLTRGSSLVGEQTRRALRQGPADLFTLIRMWSTDQSVLIEVTDPADPHSAWLISSRHPVDVLDALGLQDPAVR